MKTYFVQKASEGDTDAQVKAMRKMGFKFVELNEAEIIYCASITVMKNAMEAKKLKNIPLIVYCWDYYLWAHDTYNMSGDWRLYADLLRMADLILVPSKGQQRRLKELLKLNSTVVLSGVTTYGEKTCDGGYVLEALRTYPEESSGWARKACEELKIKLVHTEHQYDLETFRKTVANCRLLVCPVSEASTGGLTLVEGLWLGKPSLISDSPYQGGKDYVGKFASTFLDGSYKDFKEQLQSMWEHPTHIELTEARKHITTNLTYDVMAKKLLKVCQRFI